ncbi:unnamed protein product [Haemonchus placei]|uniref:Uncharacterized protein n=1 Tax=Haemonchus placei TaxID=6290 RepID=A0A0N4W3R4_HAEPC|nr:unnamed protein product [Haemonchus placei]
MGQTTKIDRYIFDGADRNVHRQARIKAFLRNPLTVSANSRYEQVPRVFVPLSYRGDVCDKVCSKRDGWERCEKEKKRGDWEVTCTDTRGGRGEKGPKRGGRD